jgi:hypothetical protein
LSLHFGKHFPNPNGEQDAFGKNKHRSQDLVLFKLMKFIAKAAIPDAEAIPELWERILCVDCKMIVFRKASRFRFAPRTFDFRLKSSLVFLQKQIKGKVSVLSFSKSQFSYGFTVIQGKTD